MSQWQRVYKSNMAPRAEMVKGVLELHGVQAIVVNKKDSAYAVFGYAEVLVAADDVLRALKIIEDEIQFE